MPMYEAISSSYIPTLGFVRYETWKLFYKEQFNIRDKESKEE